MRLGLIPAAGKATRWGGYYKELLPISNGRGLIDHTIEAMKAGYADVILIVTNEEKLPVLQGHLNGRHSVPIYYTIQRGENDIWSAIVEAFPFRAEWTMFAMPDTLYPVDVFVPDFQQRFTIGTFETKKSERFGVLYNGRIVNKSKQFHGRQTAWGTLAWHINVQQYWQSTPPGDYTDAFNLAMGSFNYDLRPMDFYHDMANFDEYREWMRVVA